ncbi:Desmoglein-1-beta [Dissostichus eleginoides]|uniref:Desmoglein-1-beta n=1 Tax=Dissostichus eleginoides TaxID=100907 RepID=A0AAD9C8X2_DISEL|nr:Desmoglein-1-beta [Dissostichus eleginoides]
MYDGMALPDHFLGQYYSQKVTSENENLGGKDALLIYDCEGQGSLAGSVGCCSLLESENDLQFIDDLGMKFKTLAEVCRGKKIETEVKPTFIYPPSASIQTHTSACQQPAPPPKLHQTTSQTVISETSGSSQVVKESTATAMEGMTTVRTGMIPMQYFLQPQVQNTVLLAEAPSTNLQGMVLLNGSQTGHAQGVVVQGQTVMSSGRAQGQRMVLVEKSRVHGSGGNLIHSGNLSGSKTMMVVERKAPKGTIEGLKSSQTHLMHRGTLQSGGLSGSLVVGGQSNRGQLVKEAGCLSLKRDISGSQSNVMTSSTTTVNKTPTYRKVVVQETREIH